jgi:16S rRNA (cytidine1402-2'-O)-methyltransferase
MAGVGETDTDVASDAFRAAPGSLYVVATPIGNLRDVTLRALDILRTVDIVVAEDTRVTATLLRRYDIGAHPRALHRHNEAREASRVVDELRSGRSVALVSDAGTPAISDPGARLVRDTLAAGCRVVPIPGPSALAAALSAAGLVAESVVFVGVLPAQHKARRERVQSLARLPAALVFYEAPHRIVETVEALAESLDASRRLTIAREMTKTFETIAQMPLGAGLAWLAADPNRTRGEFVVIVDAPLADAPAASVTDEARAMLAALLDELPPARAARVAARLTGLSRDLLYESALSLKGARHD